MKNEEYINNTGIYLKKINFGDVDVNNSSIFKNICYVSVLNHIFSKMIPFIQMYYLTYNKQDEDKIDALSQNFDKFYLDNKISIKIFIYCLGSIGIKFLFLLTDFINEMTIIKYFDLFQKKRYYEIGALFRNSCLISILINFLYYFPFIFLTNLFLNFILKQLFDSEENISENQIIILSNKIIGCLNINFITLIFYSINKPLQIMILCFEDKKKVLLSNFLKFLLIVTLCKYFSKRDPEFYFLLGVGSVNLISEFFCFVYLITIQSLTNPFPQAWIKINFSIVKESKLIYFVKENLWKSKEFLIVFLFNYLREFLLLISIIISTYLNQNSKGVFKMQDYSLNLFCCLCIGIFFDCNRITQIHTVKIFTNYADELFINNDSNFKYKKLLTSSKEENKDNNLIIMFQIKLIVLTCIVINIVFLLSFVIFSFFDPFCLISLINIRFDFDMIVVTAFFGLIFSISKEFFTLNKLLENKLVLNHFWFGSFFTLFTFCWISFFNLMNPFFLILSSHIGNSFFLFTYYKYLRRFDIRVVALEKILICKNINDK